MRNLLSFVRRGKNKIQVSGDATGAAITPNAEALAQFCEQMSRRAKDDPVACACRGTGWVVDPERGARRCVNPDCEQALKKDDPQAMKNLNYFEVLEGQK